MATKTEDPQAAPKIQHSRINTYMFEKKGKGNHKLGKTFTSYISDKGLGLVSFLVYFIYMPVFMLGAKDIKAEL